MPTPLTADQILALRGWKDFLSALEDSPHKELARAIGRKRAGHFLANAAALPWSLAAFHPQLLGRPLRIAWVVNEPDDIVLMDQGRWLLAAAPLVDDQDYPDTLVVHRVPGDAPPQTDLSRLVAGIPPVPFTHAPDPWPALQAFAPDLVVLLYPDIIDHDDDALTEWQWLKPLLASQTPVVGCAYDTSERSVIGIMLAFAGIAHISEADSPLFHHDTLPNGLFNCLGRHVFVLHPPKERLDATPEHHTFLRAVRQAIGHATHRGTLSPIAGALIEKHDDDDDPLVVGISNRAIAARSKRVFEIRCPTPDTSAYRQTDRICEDWDPRETDRATLEGLPDAFRAYMVARALGETGPTVQITTEMAAQAFEEMAEHEQGEMRDALRRMAQMMQSPTGIMDGRPFFVAADQQDLPTLRALLDQGQDPNEHDRAGWTALCHAAADNRVTTIKALCAWGVSPEVSLLTNQATPLLIALQRGRDEAALALIQAGANLDARGMGATPRDFLSEEFLAWCRAQGHPLRI